MNKSQRNLVDTEAFLIRGLQGFIYRLFLAKKIPGPIHFAFGHEYLASRILAYVKTPKFLFLPHRNIHYQIASCFLDNGDFNTSWFEKYLNEITLRKHRKGTGIVGAMNYTHCDMEGYTSSILANHLGVAIGSCLGQLSKDIEAVDRTVAIIGDGALEEGRFWESLIMTKTQNLPMDIVIEDNNWSMQSSISQRRCKIQLKAIAEGFGIDYVEATDNCAITFVDSGPRLLHFELETLGSTIVKKSGDQKDRTINYHAGALPDGKSRSHYTHFFSMSPSDKLSIELMPNSCEKTLYEILRPITKEFEIEGFL